MRFLTCFFFLALTSTPCSAVPTPSTPEPVNCLATREFVTALQFVREDENFKLKEADGRELAFKIVEGCTGAASRFIRVSKSLLRAGANRNTATEIALKFAKGSDGEADAFTSAFKRSIAEDGLDLDFEASVQIGLSVSKDFAGDHKKVREDFERLVDYCADASGLNLPKTQCGRFAASIARKGEPWSDGISKPFIKAFEYLHEDQGPALVAHDALKVAESLVTNGPGSTENFKQAYQFAVSDSGLQMQRSEAVLFAKKMASVKPAELKTEGREKAQASGTSH